MTWVKDAAGVVRWPDGFDDEPDPADLPRVDMRAWHRQERDARIRCLHRAGYTSLEIAARMNTTTTTVYGALDAAGIPRLRRPRQLASTT